MRPEYDSTVMIYRYPSKVRVQQNRQGNYYYYYYYYYYVNKNKKRYKNIQIAEEVHKNTVNSSCLESIII